MAASIQPMGDTTQTGSGFTSSGNPGYADASAGPQKTTPNADPHAMRKKKKQAEFLKLIQECNDSDPTVPWQPSDPQIMYVETPTPKQCNTCEYFIGMLSPGITLDRGFCTVPPHGMSIMVSGPDGCCNKWEEDTDDTMEALADALTEAGMQAQTFIFDKDKYSADDAKTWLKKHGKSSDLDSSGPSHRARQKDPGDFKDKSFRTIPIKKGIKAVVAKPKEMTEAKEKYCKSCSSRFGEDIVTCSKCGSMEFTTTPMNKYTYGG